MKILIHASHQRKANMLKITGEDCDLTVDAVWAFCNVDIRDWLRAVDWAAYDRKTTRLRLLQWPLQDVIFDIFHHASCM